MRTPYEICAVLEGEKAGGQLAGANHGCQDNFAAIVNPIFGDNYTGAREGHAA